MEIRALSLEEIIKILEGYLNVFDRYDLIKYANNLYYLAKIDVTKLKSIFKDKDNNSNLFDSLLLESYSIIIYKDFFKYNEIDKIENMLCDTIGNNIFINWLNYWNYLAFFANFFSYYKIPTYSEEYYNSSIELLNISDFLVKNLNAVKINDPKYRELVDKIIISRKIDNLLDLACDDIKRGYLNECYSYVECSINDYCENKFDMLIFRENSQQYLLKEMHLFLKEIPFGPALVLSQMITMYQDAYNDFCKKEEIILRKIDQNYGHGGRL